MALIDEPKKEYDVLKVIKQYRNNIRYTKATSKATPTATFATFQGSSPDSAKPAQSIATKAARTPPTCVYRVPHWFADCPYLIESKRPAGWVVDKDVQVAIDSKIANNLILKSQIDRTVKRSQNPVIGLSKSQDETGPKAPKAVFATSAVFIIDRDSYKLKDSWILDLSANAHVCNNLTRFNFD
jgi:hypothetical protein